MSIQRITFWLPPDDVEVVGWRVVDGRAVDLSIYWRTKGRINGGLDGYVWMNEEGNFVTPDKWYYI